LRSGVRTLTAFHNLVGYLRSGWPLFPVSRSKVPLIKDGGGFYGATTDQAVIAEWLERWPRALIATPTGKTFRHIAIDIDVKHWPISGFDALAELGWSILPETPMVITPRGGTHPHLDPGELEVPSTQGTLGRGLDVRAETSSIILPTPGSGYHWDPHYPLAVPLALAPDWLIPPEPERPAANRDPPAKLEAAYAAAAITDACWKIRRASAGLQRKTINDEAFAIGTLCGADLAPADIALGELLKAAHDVPDYDLRRRWRWRELQRQVERAFADGLRQPRRGRHG
jgi:hypothetical protein